MSLYHRLAHLKETPLVKVGQWVKRGDLIGYCGSSGNSSGPHLHYDLPMVNLGPKWTAYVYGMSYQGVKSTYADPKPYIKDNLPMRAEYPQVGYGYLQGVRGPRGVYWHSGEDCNGVNDLGKPVYAPVEGRVVHVAGMPKYLPKWMLRSLNSGWGNFVVIEQAPGFKI